MCYTYRTLPSPSEGEEHLTDAELIARSHEGDEDALVALLAKYELLVRKVIRQEIHEAPDAAHLCDDIYQDTVAKKVKSSRARFAKPHGTGDCNQKQFPQAVSNTSPIMSPKSSPIFAMPDSASRQSPVLSSCKHITPAGRAQKTETPSSRIDTFY